MGFFIGAAEESGVPLLSTQFIRPLLQFPSLMPVLSILDMLVLQQWNKYVNMCAHGTTTATNISEHSKRAEKCQASNE